MNSRDKLNAQFRIPSISKYHAKRGRTGVAPGRDGDGASQDQTCPKAKARRIAERDQNVDEEDEEDAVAMSSAQLDKHSRAHVPGGAESDGNQKEAADNAMQARLERAELQRRAQEQKAARDRLHNRPSTSNSSTAQSQAPSQSGSDSASYYLCLYRAPQTKKHKTWDNDGYLKVTSTGSCRLYDLESKRFVSEEGCQKYRKYEEGSEFFIGTREVQITQKISHNAIYGNKTPGSDPKKQGVSGGSKSEVRTFKSLASIQSSNGGSSQTKKEETSEESTSASAIPSSSFYGSPQKGARSVGLSIGRKPVSTSLYDAEKELGLVAMTRPTDEHQKAHNKNNAPVVDVHIEPRLAERLRPHQLEGIRFLYDSVMGLRKIDVISYGAILADEMGLGKTVQTIAVVQMLLKQSCYAGAVRNKVIDRALVVCPSSLVKNWKNEFVKWTGGSISTGCVDQNTNLKSMINGRYDVLIINYEKLRNHVKDIAEAMPHFGLLVCDEAHRIKSQASKTTMAFDHLRIDRRILLTGTPVQNNLSEFFTMIDFIAHGLLGDAKTFKNLFEDKIVRGRRPGALPRHKKEATDMSVALKKITEPYMLRREASILSEHLPPKYEQVIFCSPSKLQMDVYDAVSVSNGYKAILRMCESSGKLPLEGIMILRKLCNAPDLLIKDVCDKGSSGEKTREMLGDAVNVLPHSQTFDMKHSGKLTLLVRMLRRIRKHTDDKVVVISNFTTTLDIVQAICQSYKFKFSRLDGKTKQSDRMSIVGHFNRTTAKECYIFLLSSKTGGAGLNLIGANRLIMLDCDWNPAVDAQAMARIHRDGQKKTSYIYRLLLGGTLDEKIFQRQLSKTGLSDSLMSTDKNATLKAGDDFSPHELKDIFRLRTDTPCSTHDLLGCSCDGTGSLPDPRDEDETEEKEEEEKLPSFCSASQALVDLPRDLLAGKRRQLAALMAWTHHNFAEPNIALSTEDDIVNEIIRSQHEQITSGTQTTPEPEEEDGEQEKGSRFKMSNMPVGSVLYVFAKRSAKSEEVVAVGSEPISEEEEEEEQEEEGEANE